MSRSEKTDGSNLLLAMLSNGVDHQVTIQLSSPTAAMLAAPTMVILAANQRVRVTD